MKLQTLFDKFDDKSTQCELTTSKECIKGSIMTIQQQLGSTRLQAKVTDWRVTINGSLKIRQYDETEISDRAYKKGYLNALDAVMYRANCHTKLATLPDNMQHNVITAKKFKSIVNALRDKMQNKTS